MRQKMTRYRRGAFSAAIRLGTLVCPHSFERGGGGRYLPHQKGFPLLNAA